MATEPNDLTRPGPIVTTPQASELDQDKHIPLTPEVAGVFVAEANARLADVATIGLLGERNGEYAAIINAEEAFPFRATVQNGAVTLSYAPDKTPGAMLKNISNGVTEIYKKFVTQCKLDEGKKFAFSLVLQPATYQSYLAAGLETGAHSGYLCRGC